MSSQTVQPRGRATRNLTAAVQRARLTVVPRRATRAPRVPFVALVSLLLVGGVAGLLLFNTSMQQRSFALTDLQEQAAQLSAREQSLEMRLHEMRDPQRLAARAKRLGMVPNESPAFLRLSDGKVLGRPTPATPDDAMRITPLPPVKPRSLRPKPVILEVPPKKARSDEARSDKPRQHRAERTRTGGDAR